MPTWDAPPPSVLKNTRSPAWIADWLTGVPTPNWEKLVRGRLMPARPNAHWTRPEQSKPPGAVPAVRYGVPTWLRAAETAASAPGPAGAGAGAAALETPIAPSVCGPAMPSTVRPWAAW